MFMRSKAAKASFLILSGNDILYMVTHVKLSAGLTHFSKSTPTGIFTNSPR